MDKKIVNALSAIAILAVPAGHMAVFDSRLEAFGQTEELVDMVASGFTLHHTGLQ